MAAQAAIHAILRLSGSAAKPLPVRGPVQDGAGRLVEEIAPLGVDAFN